jgi:hypothetical protein
MTGPAAELVSVGWVTPTLLLTPPSKHPAYRGFIGGVLHALSSAVLYVGREDATLIVERCAVGPLAVGPGWAGLARKQQRAILMMSTTLRKPGIDLHDFIRRGSQMTVCVVPVVPSATQGNRCEGTYRHQFSYDRRLRCAVTDTHEYDGRWLCDEHRPQERQKQ